jgi:hypothetical protein
MVTLKLHVAACRRASTAVHATSVDPIGNVLPLGGVHAVVTGAVPPEATGNVYVTAIGRPPVDAIVGGAGHVKAIVGGDGADGPEHPIAAPAEAIRKATQRLYGMARGKLQEFRMVACAQMTAKRLSLPHLGAICCAGLALWVSFGCLVAADGAGALRVGVLPSPWWLAATVALIAVVAFVAGPRHGILLWLSAVVLLPWLPLPVPAATLIWVGPLRWWLWTALAVALVISCLPPARWPSVIVNPRRAPLLAAAIAACIYLLAARQIFPQLPAGDEPHYLIIAQSLLKDGDLQIENNHQRGDYEQYFSGRLKPDYLTRGRNGQIYSIHAPGLPAIILPAFALFGYPGVLCFLALVSAGGTAFAWRAVWLVTGDALASWFGWAAVSLSVPFLFQAFTAYPDGLGATLVMAAFLVALGDEHAPTRALVAVGAALAALPWLHSRFAVVAGALGIVIVARQHGARDPLRRVVAFAIVPLAGALAWFSFFYAIYGTANPAAPYGGYTQSSIANVPQGVIGLLFDQQFGVLANAPVYLCAIAGFVPLARRHPRVAAELAGVVVPYALTASLYYMWWGGLAAPGRFLAAIFLPLAIPAGVWFSAAGPTTRVLGLGALLLSVLISGANAAVGRGALVYNVRDGASKLLRWASPLADITTGVPNLFQTTLIRAAGEVTVWLAAVAATVGVAVWLDRRRVPLPVAALVAAFVAAATGMTALSIVWTLNNAQPISFAGAASQVFHSIDGDPRQLAVRYQPFRRIRTAGVPALLPPVSRFEPPRRPTDPLATVAVAPAGTYSVEATIAGDAGVLSAGIDPVAMPIWTWDLHGVRGTWRQTITLANDARALRFDGDQRTRGAITGVVVRATKRLPPRERVSGREASRAARYGHATVFLLDGGAYVEAAGTWIAGAAEAEFAIVADRRSPVQLFLRNYAVANTVVLETDRWRQDIALQPREERLVALPIDAATGGVVLRVRSATGAAPADVEPGNRDRRILGCWIETR